MREGILLEYIKENCNKDMQRLMNSTINKNESIKKAKEDFLKEQENIINEKMNQGIDFDVDFLNEWFSNNEEAFKGNLKDDVWQLNKSLLVPKIQKLNLSKEQQQHRDTIWKKAQNITINNILFELDNDFESIYNKKKEKVEFGLIPEDDETYNDRGINRVLNLTMGSSLDKESKKLPREKAEMFIDMLKKCRESIVKVSKNLSDEEFVNVCENNIKNIIASTELQDSSIDKHIEQLGLKESDFTKDELDIIKQWKEVDSKVAVDMAGRVQTRLDIMANPYYKVLSVDDIIRVNVATKTLLDYKDSDPTPEQQLINADKPVMLLSEDGKTSPFMHLNSALDFLQTPLKREFDKINKESYASETLEVMLNSTFDALNSSVYENKLNEYQYYDFETSEVIDKNQMIKKLANGARIGLMEAKEGEQRKIAGLIDADNQFGNLEIQIPPVIFDKPLVSNKDLENLSKRLSKVSVFFSQTKEFADFEKTIKLMTKAKTEQEYYDLSKTAVKFAKDYLKNKTFSSKKKTPKTYERMQFAQVFIDTFTPSSEIYNFNNEEYKKFMQKDIDALGDKINNFDLEISKVEKLIKTPTVKEIIKKNVDEKKNNIEFKQENLKKTEEVIKSNVEKSLLKGMHYDVDRDKVLENYVKCEKIHKLHALGQPKQYTPQELKNESNKLNQLRDKLRDDFEIYRVDLNTAYNKTLEENFKEIKNDKELTEKEINKIDKELNVVEFNDAEMRIMSDEIKYKNERSVDQVLEEKVDEFKPDKNLKEEIENKFGIMDEGYKMAEEHNFKSDIEIDLEDDEINDLKSFQEKLKDDLESSVNNTKSKFVSNDKKDELVKGNNISKK